MLGKDRSTKGSRGGETRYGHSCQPAQTRSSDVCSRRGILTKLNSCLYYIVLFLRLNRDRTHLAWILFISFVVFPVFDSFTYNVNQCTTWIRSILSAPTLSTDKAAPTLSKPSGTGLLAFAGFRRSSHRTGAFQRCWKPTSCIMKNTPPDAVSGSARPVTFRKQT